MTTKLLSKYTQVPEHMTKGEKFIKWDEDSVSVVPVTLKVDRYGFYVHWIDQKGDSDVLDIAFLRDTRTGKQARTPKDPKLRHNLEIGCSTDAIEDKTVTLVFGSDFVNLSFVNFCCSNKETAKVWSDELLKLNCNRVQTNASTLTSLLKAYTKLTLLVDSGGKIPVKNVTKMFSSTKEDKKRIEKALEESGLSSNKNDTLDPAKFEFEHFFTFYKNLTTRTEVEKVFNNLCGDNNDKTKLMSTDQFVDFVNKIQRDPRLNEILHPYANAARARDLILEYELDQGNAQNGLLSLDGFLRYLMSEDNPIVSNTKLELSDDMDQPLAHYFINSSHNTYLTGHQLTGKSSVEMYRQCLLAGCRCVELDFWNGKTDEPVIVHGYTLVPDISAREVIEAIAESAFKTSDYPVILSFENHCNPKQQAKIAQYCREYFGDKLLDIPMDSFKLEPDCSLPPPSMLKNKIIIKNKKKHRHYRKGKKKTTEHESPSSGNGEVGGENSEHRKSITLASMRQGSKDSSQDDEEDEDDASSTGPEDEDDENTPAEDIKIQMQGKPSDKVSCRKETEAGAEISALVNYVQPVHFVSFEYAQRKKRYYEMSSFDEKQAMALLREQPIEFVNYNKCQLSRVYPAGIRIDSSNFMPIKFWNAGCQLVAINYQNLDVAMQLNLGIFEYNARCGYILKPECLRRRDRCFDPFAESPVDGIVAGTVSIHVLSGQFLFTDKKVGIYVDVEMYGLPADTVRKRFRSRPLSSNNNLNPIFTNEPFVFTKVVLPDLAAIRIAAYDDSQRLIGHRILPVTGLCPGYRHVTLRNESGQALPLATLFLNIVVKDFVPDGLSELAEALANPIKFQSDLERRAKQLAVFMDDIEYDISTEPGKPENHNTDPRNSMPTPSPRVRPKPRTPGGSVQSDPIESSDPNVPLPSSTVLPSSPSLDNVLVAESLEKLFENKLIKEKKLELEKKLKTLHKKCDKEKNRLLVQIAAHDTERSRLKCMPQITTKLVKRMSFKNIEGLGSSLSTLQVTPDGSDIQETEHTITSNPKSEKLLAVSKECITQEKDMLEEYHELIYNCLDKIMKTSQSNQLKTLRVLLEKETDAVMRRLETDRKEKVKSLAKKHKDKDEMIRVKRELATAMVERGVNERMRLTQLYEKRKEDLEKQHEQIRQQIRIHKTQAQADIFKEFEAKMKSVMEENGHTITE